MNPLECGCEVKFDKPMTSVYDSARIVFCPMHEVANDMGACLIDVIHAHELMSRSGMIRAVSKAKKLIDHANSEAHK